MAPQKLRTAIYARVSTLDQDPAMQLRELRAYDAHRRLPIAAEFIDHVSGTTTDRPALARLWQAVRARKLDTILVWKFDRFARSTKQLRGCPETFQHHCAYVKQLPCGNEMQGDRRERAYSAGEV
jgi:DNA invertase Pin-like site-specific DNA recombinase